MARDDVSARCHSIEECYEFFLAYAGQGLSGKENSASISEVREFLNRAAQALTGLADSYASTVMEAKLQPVERYAAFQLVIEKDARDSLAAIQLVLAQPTISSQLIDN